MKAVNLFDLVVIFTYFLIIMGIGLFFMKVNKGGKEYFTGGNMIPWWMSGLSLYMGNFSAWIFTGDLRLPKLIGLKPSRRIPLYNGALECRLYAFDIVAGAMRRQQALGRA